MLSWVFGKKRKAGGKRKAPAYDKAKAIAEKGSADERAELAAYEDLEPELLYFFTDDDSTDVRRAVAGNDGTPLQADVILSTDPDVEVRAELAVKIGRIIPTLTEIENQRLTEMVLQVLETLAEDESAQVRAVIADEIKLLTNVPKRVIRKLARDLQEIVSAPILEYSPLLSDKELVQILASGIQGGALIAIARRRSLAEPVAEAIVETQDTDGVVALLDNPTASIGEKVMDVIAIAAARVPEWQRPLVERANLSRSTIRRIATFVSAALVERLMARHDLDQDLAEELRLNVRHRIDTGDLPEPAERAQPADERAEALYKAGKLTEAAIAEAIDEGDTAFVPHALTHLAKLPLETVQAMLRNDSGKAVVTLCWKAGLTMQIAVSIQRRIARLPPKAMIHDPGGGKFPLSQSELDWYLDYFTG